VSVEVQATPDRRERNRGRTPAVTVAPATPRRRSGALEWLGIVALLGGVAVVLPALIARHYGALGVPRSDDWSYLLTLFRWTDTGKLNFNGWVSMTLVGQIGLASPVVRILGHSITAVQLFTSFIGLAGLLGVVFIGRQVVRPVWWAVFVAGTIAIGPLWGPLAPTFMTDLPTFAFEMLTLAAACVAFRRRPMSLPWFTVSVVLGFVAVSIRQYAVIPVIAVVVVAVCLLVADREWRKLGTTLVISAIFGIAALALLYWWSGLPDSKSLSPTMPGLHSTSLMVTKIAGFLRLIGLLILPVVVLAGPIGIVRRAWRASAALTTLIASGAALWLAGTYVHLPSVPFVGNYLARDGVLSNMVLGGKRPPVIPASIYDLLVLLGSLSAVVLVLVAVPFLADLPRRVRDRELLEIENPIVAMMGLTVAGFTVAYSLAVLTALPVYDRYVLPVLPLIALIALHAAPREPRSVRVNTPRIAAAGVSLVLLTVVGLAFTVDSASFDGTRWKVAVMATEKGYQPLQIDGGFEWLGYHLQRAFRFKTYDKMHEESDLPRPCVTILSNPTNPGPRLVASAQATAFSHSPVTIVARRTQALCAKQERSVGPTPTAGAPAPGAAKASTPARR
jgi:hypothetical protein